MAMNLSSRIKSKTAGLASRVRGSDSGRKDVDRGYDIKLGGLARRPTQDLREVDRAGGERPRKDLREVEDNSKNKTLVSKRLKAAGAAAASALGNMDAGEPSGDDDIPDRAMKAGEARAPFDADLDPMGSPGSIRSFASAGAPDPRDRDASADQQTRPSMADFAAGGNWTDDNQSQDSGGDQTTALDLVGDIGFAVGSEGETDDGLFDFGIAVDESDSDDDYQEWF